MPLVKCNLIMAKATGLIFQFDVTSAQQVPFGIPQYVQYILHGFMSRSSLLTVISVDLAVARDGFPS